LDGKAFGHVAGRGVGTDGAIVCSSRQNANYIQRKDLDFSCVGIDIDLPRLGLMM